MNKMKIDDQLLDELVAGELRGEAYRQTLLAIEAQPQLWRKCALAFLREQAIQQELRALAAGDVDWSGAKSDSLVESESSAAGRSAESSSQSEPSRAKLSSALQQATWWSAEGRNVLAQRLAALAALLLVSFSVGWLGAGLRIDDVASINAINSSNASSLGNLMGSTGASGATDLVTGSKPSQLSTTIPVSRDALQYLGMNQMEIPQELLELERAGKVRIDTMEMWVPVPMEDGSSLIVPFLEYRVEPIAKSY